MKADNPLTLLASITRNADKISLSTQKLNRQGNPTGVIETHEICIDPAGDPIANADLVKKIAKTIRNRSVRHHDQPEIKSYLNILFTRSGAPKPTNSFCCTYQTLVEADSCNYAPDLVNLAQRQGVSESQLLRSESDSRELCSVYTNVFTAYIRHLREQSFSKTASKPNLWADTLSADDKKLLRTAPRQDQLPPGWTVEEAQSLWLMHCGGEELSQLAGMVGQPKSVLVDICAMFSEAAAG
jgi:hypothetical protein